MNSVMRTAKTVEEAVEQALQQLGATREEVEIEVIEEPKGGLFGFIGSKDAVVKVVKKVQDSQVKEVIEETFSEPVVIETVEESVEDSTELSSSEMLLTSILKGMNINADVVTRLTNSGLELEVVGADERDTGIVIGRRGETLDAIQYLLNLAENKGKQGYTRVTLDINGYRGKREDSLVRLAHKTAEKAKKYRRNMRFEPMNPYERRIIHSALQKVSGISTVSEGEEPYRKVVIRVNKK